MNKLLFKLLRKKYSPDEESEVDSMKFLKIAKRAEVDIYRCINESFYVGFNLDKLIENAPTLVTKKYVETEKELLIKQMNYYEAREKAGYNLLEYAEAARVLKGNYITYMEVLKDLQSILIRNSKKEHARQTPILSRYSIEDFLHKLFHKHSETKVTQEIET